MRWKIKQELTLVRISILIKVKCIKNRKSGAVEISSIARKQYLEIQQTTTLLLSHYTYINSVRTCITFIILKDNTEIPLLQYSNNKLFHRPVNVLKCTKRLLVCIFSYMQNWEHLDAVGIGQITNGLVCIFWKWLFHWIHLPTSVIDVLKLWNHGNLSAWMRFYYH